jgi:hypothetical protein
MIRNGLVTGFLVLMTTACVFAATARASDEKEAVGTWKLTYNPGDNKHEATLTVQEEGSGLKAKFEEGDRKFDVTKVEFKDGKLTFTTRTQREGEPATAAFEGKVKGDAIEGEATWEYNGMMGSFPFDGKRQAAKFQDVLGTWRLTYDPGNGERKPTLTVTKEGAGLKGKFEEGDRYYSVTDIRSKDGTLTFTVETERDDATAVAKYEGKVRGDAIEGETRWEYNGMTGSFPFKGKREAAKPRG